ncbi:collagen-like protein, partial [Nocardioides sp.]|uniref:collagen-like triple helix repeat-containing protein n=1 Tax=Nocardioides sp. TaxID=35761 RepID=UPI00262905D2
MSTTSLRRTAALSLSTIALTGIVTTGLSQPAEASPRRVISACFSVETGKLRIVSSITKCRASEDHIRWVRGGKASTRARGPKGATGAKGAQGATGAVGARGAIGPAGPVGATG